MIERAPDDLEGLRQQLLQAECNYLRCAEAEVIARMQLQEAYAAFKHEAMREQLRALITECQRSAISQVIDDLAKQIKDLAPMFYAIEIERAPRIAPQHDWQPQRRRHHHARHLVHDRNRPLLQLQCPRDRARNKRKAWIKQCRRRSCAL